MRDNIESGRIESLLPRQLIEDSAALIEFLKEYYNFMNAEGGPSHAINSILANRDIDSIVDDFLLLLEKELGSSFVTTLEANKEILYKNIVQFYQAKGSVESFKVLFRLLYNTEIEVSFPKEKILVASDGRWIQQNSIFLDITAGDAFDLFAKVITITTPDGLLIPAEVERIKQVGQSNYYEIFVTKSINIARIVLNSTISEDGVVGTVVPAVTTYEIVYGGQNFSLAQFVDIEEGTGTGVTIKTIEVDSATGALTDIKFINFGVEYSDTFYAMIVPTVDVVGGVDMVISTDPDADQITYPNRAIIKFTTGPVVEYRGEYSTNNGFLSDDIYLQDNFFYQQYSYLIRSSERFDEYKNVLYRTVHPAGMVPFGEFVINNSFDLSRNLDALRRYLRTRLEDVVDTEDAEVKHMYKPVAEIVITGEPVWEWTLDKPLTETITVNQLPQKHFFKGGILDLVGADDSNLLISRAKTVLDSVTTDDSALSVNFNSGQTDSINSSSIGIIELTNDIYAENYFAEDYSEGLTSFN